MEARRNDQRRAARTDKTDRVAKPRLLRTYGTFLRSLSLTGISLMPDDNNCCLFVCGLSVSFFVHHDAFVPASPSMISPTSQVSLNTASPSLISPYKKLS